MENSVTVPQKSNYHIIQQFNFWVYTKKKMKAGAWKKYLYTFVHSSINHNSQKVEATQVSIDRLIDKQNVI
jgi:hypothetical protein